MVTNPITLIQGMRNKTTAENQLCKITKKISEFTAS